MEKTYENDPVYKKLKADYLKAISNYVNAICHRERRKNMTERYEMRPVGSPVNFKISEEPVKTDKKTDKPLVFKVYMGEILKWQKLNPAPGIPEGSQYEGFDVEKVYDEITEKFIWDCKIRYRNCKSELLKYIYHATARSVDETVRSSLNHAALLQLLGYDKEENSFENIKVEIEKKCKDALAYYKSVPEPKSREAIIVLMKGLADAQLVGLESKTTSDMEAEFQILSNAGIIEPG